MIIFFTIFLFLLIGRTSSFLLSYEILNVDESQMMANAIRFHLNGYNIFDFDGTSSGFLNSLILNWPNIIGLDVTFLSTRLTAVVILSLIFYLIFLYFKTELGKFLSLLLITPGIILFSFTGDPDYQHYSSELLSTLFVVFALYGIKRNSFKESFFNSITFLFLGLIIFSKSQMVPTALSLFGTSCIYLLFKKNYEKLIKISFLFSFPFILFMFLYYLTGYLYDYYLNYFEFSKAVVSKYSLGENLSSNISNTNKTIVESNLAKHLLYNSLFHYFYFQILITIFILFTLTRKRFISILKNFDFILIVICIISVVFSIIVTGVIYRHYLTPLIPLTTLFVGTLLAVDRKTIFFSRNFKIYFAALYLFLFTSFIFESDKFYVKNLKSNNFSVSNIKFESPKILDFLNVNNGNLFVWGWAPQWYVLSYKFPSDRATISQKNIEDYSNKKYFNERLIGDLGKNTPNVIIDTVKPNSFYYNRSNHSIKNNPTIKRLIDKKYTLLNINSFNCPDFYLRNQDFQTLKNKLIKFDTENLKIKSKLNDFSIDEDICEDSYIFDSSDDQIIKFNFPSKSRIKNILVLASRKNDHEVFLDIKFVKDKKEIISKSIKLKQYPFWTNITFDGSKDQIESVNIDIKNLIKFNYGLNEIKFYRK